MKSRNDDIELLRAVLEEAAPENFRAQTLESMLAGARHRRQSQRRYQLTIGVTVGLLIPAALVFWLAAFSKPDRAEAPGSSVGEGSEPVPSASEMVRGTGIRILSDEDLFAMFPNRPLALVGSLEHPRAVFLDELELGHKGEP